MSGGLLSDPRAPLSGFQVLGHQLKPLLVAFIVVFTAGGLEPHSAPFASAQLSARVP